MWIIRWAQSFLSSFLLKTVLFGIHRKAEWFGVGRRVKVTLIVNLTSGLAMKNHLLCFILLKRHQDYWFGTTHVKELTPLTFSHPISHGSYFNSIFSYLTFAFHQPFSSIWTLCLVLYFSSVLTCAIKLKDVQLTSQAVRKHSLQCPHIILDPGVGSRNAAACRSLVSSIVAVHLLRPCECEGCSSLRRSFSGLTYPSVEPWR